MAKLEKFSPEWHQAKREAREAMDKGEKVVKEAPKKVAPKKKTTKKK